MSRIGDGLDLPFESNPSAQIVTDEFMVSGGVVIAAATLPMPDDGEHKPAVMFRFATPTGGFYPPTLLVLDDEQAEKLPQRFSDAVRAARQAATKENRAH